MFLILLVAEARSRNSSDVSYDDVVCDDDDDACDACDVDYLLARDRRHNRDLYKARLVLPQYTNPWIVQWSTQAMD